MKVVFPFEKEISGLTKYPDDIKFFRGSEIIGSNMVADYSGKLKLTEYKKPAVVVKPKVNATTMTAAEFRKVVLEKLGIECL